MPRLNRTVRRSLLLMLGTTGVILIGILAEGRLSGWSRLARQFPVQTPASELQLSTEEGGLGNARWFHRIAPLQAAMGTRGLRLGYPFPYSLGHAPMEIPWDQLGILEVAAEDDGARLLLSVAGPEPARISLRGDLATVVADWIAVGK